MARIRARSSGDRARFTRISRAKMPGITLGFAEAPMNFLRVRKEGGPGRAVRSKTLPRVFAREFLSP
jgi:hypothetical protein